MALEKQDYPECAAEPECDLPGEITKGTNLLATNPVTNCDNRLKSSDESEYPALPIQLTDSNVELRSGSATKPIKLPKLQKNQELTIPALVVAGPDGTIKKWIPLACDKRLIWKDGLWQLVDDVFPEIFKADFCECEVEDIEFVIGIKSFERTCEATGVTETFHQACFVEKTTVTSGGTVTSVGLVLPTDEFTVADSPVVGSGDIDVTWKVQAANEFFAGPTTGADAVPVFRPIVAGDITFLSSVYQPLDPDLTSLAAAATTDRIYYRPSAGTWAPVTIGPGLDFTTGTLSTTGGSGTVTSVGLAAPAIFTVLGSPITTSGTLTFSLNTQAPNTIFSGPSSGVAAGPTFRSLVPADVPWLPATYQPLDADLTSLSSAAGTDNIYYRNGPGSWVPVTIGSGLTFAGGTIATTGGSGTVTSVGLNGPAAGISVSPGGPITTSGTFTLALTNDLAGLEGVSGTGYARRSAVDTWVIDTTIPNSGLTNSTITIGTTPVSLGGTMSLVPADIPWLPLTYQPLDGDLTSLSAAAATNSLYYRQAVSNWQPVIIGDNLTLSSGTLSVTTFLYDRDDNYSVDAGDNLNHHNNDSAPIDIIGTLPSLTAGGTGRLKKITFSNLDNTGLEHTIQAAAGDRFKIGPYLSSAGGTLNLPSEGDSVTIESVNNDHWLVTSFTGYFYMT